MIGKNMQLHFVYNLLLQFLFVSALSLFIKWNTHTILLSHGEEILIEK